MDHRPGFTGQITRAAARHPWRTLGLWAVLLVVAFAASSTMDLSSNTMTAGTEASKATDLIDDRLREDTPPEEFVIVESPTATADEAAFGGFVDSLLSDLRALDEVESVTSYRDGAEGLVSDDGHVALIIATLTGDEEDAADTAEPLVDVVERVDGTEGFRVTTVGFGSVEGEFSDLIAETLEQGEIVGISVALVILLLVLGAAVAAGLPIILALLSIFVAVGATALVSNVMEMSEFIVFIITLIGLAVGIDYSLLTIHRVREERARGRDKIEAITTAGATASRTVFFSGLAVAIALAGMLIIPDPIFRSFAVGAILVVAATVLAALTLLPAVLSLLGDRVNWLTLPFIGRRDVAESSSGFWGWITKVVTARPVISVLLTGGLLITLAIPVLNINLGNNGINSLPEDSNPRHAFDVANEEFSDGVLTAEIVIDAPDVNTPPVQSGIAELTASLDEDEFFGTSELETNEAGDLALLTVAMPGDFSSPESESALKRLRDDYIPAAFDGESADIFVGGPTAETVDDVATQKEYLPFVFTFVLGFSFPLDRSAVEGGRHEPVVGRGSVRHAGARLPGGHRQRTVRFPGVAGHRVLAAAIPVRHPVWPLDGLSRVPAQPDQGALRRDRRQYGLRRLRAAPDGRYHHRRGADHGRGVRRHGIRRYSDLPAGGLWPRRRHNSGRHDHPHGTSAGEHGAAGRLELVLPRLARMAAGDTHRGRGGASDR